MGKQEYGSKRGLVSRFLRRIADFRNLLFYITPLFLVLGSKFKSKG